MIRYQSEDHVLIGGELTMGIRRAQLLMKLLHVGLKPVQREREREK